MIQFILKYEGRKSWFFFSPHYYYLWYCYLEDVSLFSHWSSTRNETKHRFSLDIFANVASGKIEAPSVSSLYVCLFSIYRVEVEIVARVYRAIFDLFLHPTSHRPTPSFPSAPPPRPSQQPAAILPFVTLHYLPLRNVEDASFHSGARKISSADSPASLGSRFMKFGDDLKLLHRVSCCVANQIASFAI